VSTQHAADSAFSRGSLLFSLPLPPHAYTHTHTHTHSLSLSHTHTHTQARTHTHKHAHTVPQHAAASACSRGSLLFSKHCAASSNFLLSKRFEPCVLCSSF